VSLARDRSPGYLSLLRGELLVLIRISIKIYNTTSFISPSARNFITLPHKIFIIASILGLEQVSGPWTLVRSIYRLVSIYTSNSIQPMNTQSLR
jgi:hypothetical protein